MRTYYALETDNPFKKHPLTMLLIIINLAIFILFNLVLLERGIDFVSLGTNSWVQIKEGGEYYRLLTSIFLHADIEHVMNNMLILFVIGGVYEISEGKLRFFTIYFVGGLLASLASMTYNMFLRENISSLGASGAIFALVGASIASVLKNRNKLRKFSKTQLLIFTFLSIYGGLRDSHTDNMAHLAGLFAGFLLGFIISKRDCF